MTPPTSLDNIPCIYYGIMSQLQNIRTIRHRQVVGAVMTAPYNGVPERRDKLQYKCYAAHSGRASKDLVFPL